MDKGDVLSEYEAWVDLMDLRKFWKIEIYFGGVEDDNYAHTVVLPEYHRAEIRFNLDKLKTREDVRKTVVHELMHVVMSRYTQTVMDLLTGNKPAKKVMKKAEEDLMTTIEKWKLWK